MVETVAKNELQPVGGRSLIGLTCMLKKALLWCIGEAERIKGSAPLLIEITIVYFKHYTKIFPYGAIGAFIYNLYREDLFYADQNFAIYSMTGPDGSDGRKTFEMFSERFRRIYPEYMLDCKMNVVAKPETTVINLQQLTKLLKSKD